MFSEAVGVREPSGLEDEDAYVRANAAMVLGRWGRNPSSAVPTLLSAVIAHKRNDASVDVSYIGNLVPVSGITLPLLSVKSPLTAQREALSELVRAMTDDTKGEDSSMVRVAAALAVIRIKDGDAKALGVLVDALSNSSEKVRHEAVSNLAAAGPKAKAALEATLKKIPEESPGRCAPRIWTLRQLRRGEGRERIVRILARALDEKGCVRDSAIRSLAKMGSFSKVALPKIEAILLSNPKPEDYCNNPRSAAVEAVVRVAEPEVAMRILRDKVAGVRDGVELAREIIPHLETPRRRKAQKNRETLKWLLEECQETEKELAETLNRAGGAAQRTR